MNWTLPLHLSLLPPRVDLKDNPSVFNAHDGVAHHDNEVFVVHGYVDKQIFRGIDRLLVVLPSGCLDYADVLVDHGGAHYDLNSTSFQSRVDSRWVQ